MAELVLVRPLRGLKAKSLLIVLASFYCIAAHARAEPNQQIPPDFRVTIHDYPGLSDWKPFETTIMADGTVLQTVFDEEHPKAKRYAIAHQKIARLFDVIQKQHFFSLATEYPTEATDCATYVITVMASGRNHRVRFATCFPSRGTEEEWNRFLRVWAAALRAFPSPNREQKAEHYNR